MPKPVKATNKEGNRRGKQSVSEYGEAAKKRFLEMYRDNLCNASKTAKQFADEVNEKFNVRTFYRWKNKDQEFADQVKMIEQASIEDAEEELKSQGINEGNTTALIFLLKNKHPEYGKQKVELEGNIQHNVDHYDHLSEEQLRERITEVAGKVGVEEGGEGDREGV